MQRPAIAVVGFGRLGRACVDLLAKDPGLRLAGVVTRPGADRAEHPPGTRFAQHLRELEKPRAVLLCVPTPLAGEVAASIVQQRMPLVECAQLEGAHRERYYAELRRLAHLHRVPVLLAAGWDPGLLPALRSMVERLIPDGHTRCEKHPGLSAHHSAAAAALAGVKDAMVMQARAPDGNMQYYVYVEAWGELSADEAQTRIQTDPLFAGCPVQVFAVPDLASLQAAGSGVVLERLLHASPGRHESFLIEARFDSARLAARIMLDAARCVHGLPAGARRFHFL